MGRLLRRIGYLLRRRRAEQDLRDEIAFHAHLLAERRQAASHRAMGNVTLAREDARAVWVSPWIDAAAAVSIPAWRAAHVEPIIALRSE